MNSSKILSLYDMEINKRNAIIISCIRLQTMSNDCDEKYVFDLNSLLQYYDFLLPRIQDLISEDVDLELVIVAISSMTKNYLSHLFVSKYIPNEYNFDLVKGIRIYKGGNLLLAIKNIDVNCNHTENYFLCIDLLVVREKLEEKKIEDEKTAKHWNMIYLTVFGSGIVIGAVLKRYLN